MIRPIRFDYNYETAVNNYYQQISNKSAALTQEEALLEFDNFVIKLREKGIQVIVIEDTETPHTPDSIFPNNWISFHEDGKVVTYPMFAENRRIERRKDVIAKLGEIYNLKINEEIDFTHYESENRFLEGTGSMILDRANKYAYAAISIRTDVELFRMFCLQFGYKPIAFTAYQTFEDNRLPIYHTNVMMCIGDKFAVICLDSIDNVDDQQEVIEALEESDKEIIDITEDQKHHFAGNMLQVQSKNGQPYLVMSTAAFQSLNQDQLNRINKYCPIIHSSLNTIETLGGGSARCMMAEVFLPKKE